LNYYSDVISATVSSSFEKTDSIGLF